MKKPIQYLKIQKKQLKNYKSPGYQKSFRQVVNFSHSKIKSIFDCLPTWNNILYFVSITQTQLLSYNNLLILLTMGCAQTVSFSQTQNESHSQGILSRPHIFFLLGGPGSGKGTQAQNLIRDYKFKHLSTGDLLREQKIKGGELAQQIDSYMKEGKLLPSELVVKLLKNCIQTYGNRRYLFDGFPRNQENWNQFEKQLSNEVVVRNLIYFDCPSQVLVDRMMQRAKTSGRTDDNPETIKKRLQTFEKQTLPIVNEFQRKNNCIRIDASKNRDQVYEQLKSKLNDVNVRPPTPAQMFFVLGGPGSGKGTQCDILVKKYKFIHLSTGDLLREEIKAGSNLGKEIDTVIKEGKLVSSDLMVRIIQQKIQRNNYGGRYLLDGFPRGQQNMDVWQKIMAKWVNLKSVIYFQCTEDQLKRRLLERGKTSGRSDDNEESIIKRLNVFNDQTRPAIAFYQKQNKVKKINANRPIEVITKDVQDHLDSLGVFPQN